MLYDIFTDNILCGFNNVNPNNTQIKAYLFEIHQGSNSMSYGVQNPKFDHWIPLKTINKTLGKEVTSAVTRNKNL